MKLFKSSNMQALIQDWEPPCVSIYLPTHTAGQDIKEDPLRLKNLLKKCRDKLESEDLSKKTRQLLRLGFDLLDRDAFWRHQNRGLSLFMSPSFTEFFHLPTTPEEEVYVGHFFNILPLIPASFKDRTYFLVVLGQKEIKLLRVDGSQVHDVELQDIPKTLDEFRKYDVVEEHIQVHTTPSGKSAGTDAMFHGHGNIADDARHKKNVERYIKHIAKKIDTLLYGSNAPLITAGIDYERAFYQENSSYRFLMDEGIPVEFGQIDIDTLRRRSEEIVQNYFDKDIEASIEKYYNQINPYLTSEDIQNILAAAYEGRIDTLLIDITKHVPGTFEPSSRQIDIHSSAEAGDEDLLNLAAVYALRNNADVYPVKSDKIVGGGPIGAVFRY